MLVIVQSSCILHGDYTSRSMCKAKITWPNPEDHQQYICTAGSSLCCKLDVKHIYCTRRVCTGWAEAAPVGYLSIWIGGALAILTGSKACPGGVGNAGRGKLGGGGGAPAWLGEWGQLWLPPLDHEPLCWTGQPDMGLLQSSLTK